MNEDKIYDREKIGGEPFRFDESVARVFPDMLKRSIPGYAASLDAIGSLAARFITDNSIAYDLGCSLGAASLAMRQGIRASTCKIIAVDNASAMVDRCKDIIGMDDHKNALTTPVEVVLADIREIEIQNASMVVLNYTLQFLETRDRDALIQKIFSGLNPGGVMVLSEKIIDEDPHMEKLLIELYHEHKRRNNYSALEIARKRAALENVLIPETVSQHRQRLESAGFRSSAVWLRFFNFVSMIAIKP